MKHCAAMTLLAAALATALPAAALDAGDGVAIGSEAIGTATGPQLASSDPVMSSAPEDEQALRDAIHPQSVSDKLERLLDQRIWDDLLLDPEREES